MREALAEHELPQPAGSQEEEVFGAAASGQITVGTKQAVKTSMMPFGGHSGMSASRLGNLQTSTTNFQPVSGLRSLACAALHDGSTDAPKQRLLRKLVQLTPEQIGRLPEGTKIELLHFLRQHSQQSG